MYNHQLETFIRVADAGSFNKAAEESYITPTAIIKQIAAWPMSSFVAVNDFTGKNVVPFCTSLSSGIGQSGELLAELAGTGSWLDGYRFSSSTTANDIAALAESLSL